MKRYQLIFVTLFAAAVLFCACEYDGPTAQWDLVQQETDSPTITEVLPAVAVPGFNYITINGENFSNEQDNVSVYINGYDAEIVDFSSTSIKIRRPDCSGDSLSIKVDVYGAVNLGRWEPYTISPVYEPYGQFLSGTELGCLAIDKDENLYVVENTSTREVYKITPDNEKILLGNADPLITDAAIYTDGTLVLFGNRKDIYQVETDTVSIYATVEDNVYTGAFDSYGTLYASGRRADINIILPDSVRQAGLYASDEIFCLRVVDDYLYALIELRNGTPEIAIWRHQILDDQGNLGNAELVFDWALSGTEFEDTTPATFTIDSEGGIYIGSDNAAPILYYNPSTGYIDEIYKGILPSGATQLVWGNGNYLYMVYSDGSSENDLLKIDMGRPEDRDI